MTDSLPDSDRTPKPRGLWSLISQASAEPPSIAELAEETPATPRSLFDVMRQASSTTLPTSEREEECDEVPAERNPESLRYNSLEDESSVRESIPLIVVTNSRNPSQRVAASRRTRQTWAGLACGIASVVLSALAIRPEIGMSLPASITGFAAIILGYLRLSSTSPRDHSPSTKWISSAMIASGVLGIFLGPLYFSGLGRGWRESSGQTLMRRHLNGNRTDPQVLDPLSTGDVDER